MTNFSDKILVYCSSFVRFPPFGRKPDTLPLRGEITFIDKHVAERGQQVKPVGVLGQAAIADLGITELTLDGTERMLDLGPNTGFDLLRSGQAAISQRLTRHNGALGDEPIVVAMPVLFALIDTPIALVAKYTFSPDIPLRKS